MDKGDADTDRQLRHRDLLAAIGTEALRGRDLDQLLTEACRAVAEGLQTPLAKVLEYLPERRSLLVRAGVGWHQGVVGHAELGADDGSPAGHALRTATPVISNDLATDDRFRTPKLLQEHGVRRAINVIIQGDGVPFGVLEADGRVPGRFLTSDVGFLQAAANLLGVAVERSRREAEVAAALESRSVLLREADHRIKNSLQLVASLLSMQRSRLADPESVAALDGAISRVRAIAEAHRALFQSRDPRIVDFGRMLADICTHVASLAPNLTIQCQPGDALEIDAERAIPLGLIVNELLTNAAKHAYTPGSPGVVTAQAERRDGDLAITIADSGQGLPAAAPASRALGGTIMAALAKQISLRIETTSEPDRGTSVTTLLRLGEPAARPASGS